MSRWMRALRWFGLAKPEPTQDRRLDFSSAVFELDVDTSSFTTALMRLNPSLATRQRVYWLEDELFPRIRSGLLGWTRWAWHADWAWAE